MNNYDVLVFGGSSGIGLASAIEFSKNNLYVLSLSRNATASDELKTKGIAAMNYNILDTAVLPTLLQTTPLVKHIVLTTLFPLPWGLLKDIDICESKNYFEQLWSYLLIIKEACNSLRHLESITVISGAISKNNKAGTINVKLMASSLNEVAQTLAVEIAPIRINVVAPGLVDTPLYDSMTNKEQIFNEFKSNVPLQRVGQPDEIAKAIFFVASNKNMTGAIIHIDGGATL
ncbi:MAG: Short chain dehydrogenase [Burkholderiales bacterium]|nr:Short chain dehydrogenase [Burkholderiales bacterium]